MYKLIVTRTVNADGDTLTYEEKFGSEAEAVGEATIAAMEYGRTPRLFQCMSKSGMQGGLWREVGA